jgi:dTDP-4-amino-4,6-dideoxygalactose transaminase
VYEMGQKEIDAVRKVIEGGQLFRYAGGETARHTAKFEKALAKKLGVKHALAVSSGTGALATALAAMGIGPGDEVIVPGYTFIATALAPLSVGAVPVIAEVDETLTLDCSDVQQKISRYTKAIIPVHMLGLPCDLSTLMRIARKHELIVVEDAAQSAGGSYQGKRMGSIGHVGALSFNHYKIISSGEGGAVVTNSSQVHRRAMVYHDGGCVFFDRQSAKNTEAFFAGMNYRTSEIQSAILNVQLGRLDGILKKLRARKAAMAEIMEKSDAFDLSPCHEPEGDCATVLPLMFGSGDAAQAFAREHGQTCEMFRPIDTDRHVYTNWDPVLNHSVHHPGRNPWNWTRRMVKQGTDCCPKTLEILARTVCVKTPFDVTLADARKIARTLRG